MGIKRRYNPVPGFEEMNSIASSLLEGQRLADLAAQYDASIEEMDELIRQMAKAHPDKFFKGYDEYYKTGKLSRQRREAKWRAGVQRGKRERAAAKAAKREAALNKFIKDGPKKLKRKLKELFLDEVAEKYGLLLDDIEYIFIDWAHQHPALLGEYYIDPELTRKGGYELYSNEEVFDVYTGPAPTFLLEREDRERFFDERKFVTPSWIAQGIKEGVFPGPTFKINGEPAWSERDMGALEKAMNRLWVEQGADLFLSLPVTADELHTLSYWWKMEDQDEKGRRIRVPIEDILESIDTPLTKSEFKIIREGFPGRFPPRQGRYIKYRNPHWR